MLSSLFLPLAALADLVVLSALCVAHLSFMSSLLELYLILSRMLLMVFTYSSSHPSLFRDRVHVHEVARPLFFFLFHHVPLFWGLGIGNLGGAFFSGHILFWLHFECDESSPSSRRALEHCNQKFSCPTHPPFLFSVFSFFLLSPVSSLVVPVPGYG